MTWIAPAQHLKDRTHCLRGHEFSPENTYRLDDGYRRCKECRRQKARDYYWRSREAA